MSGKITEEYIRSLFSMNLKRLRSEQKISQLDLANQTGLSHNFINDIENCKKGVSFRTMARLCGVLDVKPYQFFLTAEMLGNLTQVYIDDFNDSVMKAIREVAEQFGHEYIRPGS